MHFLSVGASTGCILPLAGLAYTWRKTLGGIHTEAKLAAFAVAMLWSLVPLSWIDGTEIFSDTVPPDWVPVARFCRNPL